jgi:hypothetical protein
MNEGLDTVPALESRVALHMYDRQKQSSRQERDGEIQVLIQVEEKSVDVAILRAFRIHCLRNGKKIIFTSGNFDGSPKNFIIFQPVLTNFA